MMEKKIKSIKIYANDNGYSKTILEELTKKLKDRHYIISEDTYDLAIAIGGDGSFLRMVKDCNFHNQTYYLGINTGTLGFAQELYPCDIDCFLEKLDLGLYKIENIGVQETKIYTNSEVVKFCSLNEIVIRDGDLNTVHLDILVNNELLEKFAGDGILISTSFGSTAYNLSFGGSIIYNELHSLQITPIAPLNSRSYHSLSNSVIVPEQRMIRIVPNNRSKGFIITIDGENNKYDKVDKIETSVKNKKIKCLRMREYDYTKKIHEKFVKY